MRSSRGTSLLLGGRPPAEAPLLGLEHEFGVFKGGEQVDFRTIVGGLPIDGRRIDASDRSAYRCSWGGVITADGREAEIAVAPVECAPGFVTRIDAQAALAHQSLRAALADELSLRGYSTHLSVATPTRLTSRVASIYAQRFAAPMMLLLDRRDSPGLLVRTRPGRTELCGEYATGTSLRGAMAFAAGSVLASTRAAVDDRYRRRLPPVIDVTLAPAAQRTGWYVDRRGFGSDLYAAGRLAHLRSGRRTTTAQRQLEEAWTVARDALTAAGLADPDDLDATERMVNGSSPLPIESTKADEAARTACAAQASPFGDAIVDRVRRWGRISATVMSWDVVIFAIAGARTAFAAVPRHELGIFLSDLDAGHLDDAIGRYLASPPNGSRLLSAADVERASLYDEVSADRLAPNEPRPGAPLGRVESVIERLHGGNGGRNSRDDKRRRDDHSENSASNSTPPTREPLRAIRQGRKVSRLVALGGAATAIVALVAIVALALRGEAPSEAASPPPTTQPGATGGATVSRTATLPTTGQGTPTTVRAVRYRSRNNLFSAERGWTTGTCENGATPGRVMVWAAPNRFTSSSVYADQPPAGVTAFEMTWVGADRYEVLFPEGAVVVGDYGFEIVADCTGATTRRAGKSLINYSLGTDIENAPITDQPFVIISSLIETGYDSCPSIDKVLEPRVQWGISDDNDFDQSDIFAEEPLQLGSDGVFRASIDTDRYVNELMIVGHYETGRYRCDWGNG